MGQHHLAGNGADFAMVFKLETICGTDVGSNANDGGASCWCSFPHVGGFSTAVRISRRSLSSRFYLLLNKAASSFFRERYRMLEPDEAKVSSPVLRELAPSNGGWLLRRVFSSRRIQKRLTEDVAFRVFAAGNQPDFRTISDFRKLHLQRWKDCSSRCCAWC